MQVCHEGLRINAHAASAYALTCFRPVLGLENVAPIYSVMGINWTNVCRNDPFHRGFEYVAQSKVPNYWVP